jgi:hypothetical protein
MSPNPSPNPIPNPYQVEEALSSEEEGALHWDTYVPDRIRLGLELGLGLANVPEPQP